MSNPFASQKYWNQNHGSSTNVHHTYLPRPIVRAHPRLWRRNMLDRIYRFLLSMVGLSFASYMLLDEAAGTEMDDTQPAPAITSPEDD
jgi:hypothetical protein